MCDVNKSKGNRTVVVLYFVAARLYIWFNRHRGDPIDDFCFLSILEYVVVRATIGSILI